jgi:cytochrome c
LPSACSIRTATSTARWQRPSTRAAPAPSRKSPTGARWSRFPKKDGTFEFIATGLRTPNGIGYGVDSAIFIADNQGDWLPSSKILHLQPGAWYGSRSVDFEGTANLTETLPVVWLPQDEVGNSPSQPAVLNVGPYKNQMIHGEVTNGGIKRVFAEKVNGQYQGAVFHFTQGLEAGINRLAWGSDGALYAGGVGSTGNWSHSGKLHYGLQRLTYNNKPPLKCWPYGPGRTAWRLSLRCP